MKLKMLDLFSGIGGFSLAARWTNQIETVAFCEIDKFCRKVLNKHWPNVPVYTDIRELCRRTYDCLPVNADEEIVCKLHNMDFSDCNCIGTDQFLDEVGHPDIICGGFPCQDISLNGKGAGLSGSNSRLWFEYLRVIRELDPNYIVIENVTALHKRGLDVILNNLAEIGYNAEWHCINSTQFGAEHNRERIWIIAYNKSLGIQGLWPKGFQITQPLGKTLLPLRDSNGKWQVEPDVRRVNDGVPFRMDRLRSIGNAIIPHIAYLIFQKIVEIENEP